MHKPKQMKIKPALGRIYVVNSKTDPAYFTVPGTKI